MQIVILAAGRGVRLGSPEKPKCLVPIKNGLPYLELELRAMERFAGHAVIIVGGYGIECLKEFLDSRASSKIVLLENRQFEKGNLYSLLVARDILSDDFFVFNADHFYSPKNYQRMLSCRSEHPVIFCDRDRRLSDDDMKVRSQNGRLVIMQKSLSHFDCGYVGVTYVPRPAHGAYWQACEVVSRELGDAAFVEAVPNRLAAQDRTVVICDISGSWWTEIDTPADLKRAKKIILAKL